MAKSSSYSFDCVGGRRCRWLLCRASVTHQAAAMEEPVAETTAEQDTTLLRYKAWII